MVIQKDNILLFCLLLFVDDFGKIHDKNNKSDKENNVRITKLVSKRQDKSK